MQEWFTIPVAPKYEMAKDLRIRNKKTGRVLKAQGISGAVTLSVDGVPTPYSTPKLRDYTFPSTPPRKKN